MSWRLKPPAQPICAIAASLQGQAGRFCELFDERFWPGQIVPANGRLPIEGEPLLFDYRPLIVKQLCGAESGNRSQRIGCRGRTEVHDIPDHAGFNPLRGHQRGQHFGQQLFGQSDIQHLVLRTT